jgi:hypothetical protein
MGDENTGSIAASTGSRPGAAVWRIRSRSTCHEAPPTRSLISS